MEAQLQLFDKNQKANQTQGLLLNVGIKFCPDRRVVHSAVDMYPAINDIGILHVKAKGISKTSTTAASQLALRMSVVFPSKNPSTTSAPKPMTEFTEVDTPWNQEFRFECHEGLSRDALAIGQCPYLCMDLLLGSSGKLIGV